MKNNWKNDLIEIAPFTRGYFDHFFVSLYSKTIWIQGLNFSCVTVIVRVSLSSDRETATAKLCRSKKTYQRNFDQNSSVSRYNFLWLNRSLACIIAASNGQILKVHIHNDKKSFCQKKFTYNFLCNFVSRNIYHILDYIS